MLPVCVKETVPYGLSALSFWWKGDNIDGLNLIEFCFPKNVVGL